MQLATQKIKFKRISNRESWPNRKIKELEGYLVAEIEGEGRLVAVNGSEYIHYGYGDGPEANTWTVYHVDDEDVSRLYFEFFEGAFQTIAHTDWEENKEKIVKIFRTVYDVATANEWSFSSTDIRKYNFVVDAKGALIPINAIPDDTHIPGDLNMYHNDATTLPENLRVDGVVNLAGLEIKRLPSNFQFGGDIILNDTKIEELPDNLTVNGYLSLAGTPLTKLPNRLVVNGGLLISETQIEVIPEDLQAKSLNAENSSLFAIPDNLKFTGSLRLGGSQVKHLPSGLTVREDLDLSNTNIDQLPPDLIVGGKLSVNGTKIRKIPDSVSFGSLDASNSELEELPKNLNVEWLILQGSKVNQLPQSILAEYITIGSGPLKYLPDNLRISGSLIFHDREIDTLPFGLEIGGDLSIAGTSIKSLPRDLKVKGEIRTNQFVTRQDIEALDTPPPSYAKRLARVPQIGTSPNPVRGKSRVHLAAPLRGQRTSWRRQAPSGVEYTPLVEPMRNEAGFEITKDLRVEITRDATVHPRPNLLIMIGENAVSPESTGPHLMLVNQSTSGISLIHSQPITSETIEDLNIDLAEIVEDGGDTYTVPVVRTF